MDSLAALRAEISRKRKAAVAALEPPSSSASGSASGSAPGRQQKRWRTKKDIEEEEKRAYYEREKEEAHRKRQKKENKQRQVRRTVEENTPEQNNERANIPNNINLTVQNIPLNDSALACTNEQADEPPLSKAEVIGRLRALKEPATLFGEMLWDRFNRMRELELAKEEVSKGQRNVFQKKMREMEAKDAEDDIYHYTGSKLPHLDTTQTGANKKSYAREDEDIQPTCKEDYVYFQIRKYMRLWASEIDAMSKEDRRTIKGRSLVVTHEQTKDWIKPLNKLLRKRKLPKNILDPLNNIFEAAQQREYVCANRLYLEQLAIGKAPWPMGATMVGIHARAAREKIGEDKIAHVMNDERTRKYIQAVKRLLTVAQRHYPTSFSKMVM